MNALEDDGGPRVRAVPSSAPKNEHSNRKRNGGFPMTTTPIHEKRLALPPRTRGQTVDAVTGLRTIRRLPGGPEYPRFGVDLVDGRFEFDTNGSAIAARRVASAEAPDLASSDHCDMMEATAGMLDRAGSHPAVETSVPWLLRALGDPQWEREEDCPNGRDPDWHDLSCRACDGWGVVTILPDARPFWILGQPYNANLVVCALSLVGATGACDVADWRTCLAIRGDTWRVVVASLKPEMVPDGAPRLFDDAVRHDAFGDDFGREHETA
jgi:hypothetical protein